MYGDTVRASSRKNGLEGSSRKWMWFYIQNPHVFGPPPPPDKTAKFKSATSVNIPSYTISLIFLLINNNVVPLN